MEWKLEKVSKEDVEVVKKAYEDKDFGVIHQIYKDSGVYSDLGCDSCRKDNLIDLWTIYGMEMLWKEEKMEK